MKRLALAVFLLMLFATATAQVTIYSGTSNVNFAADSTGFPPIPVGNFWDNSDADTARMVSRDSVEIIYPGHYRDSLGALVVDSSMCLIKYLVAGYDATYNPSGSIIWHLANGFVLQAPIAWGPPVVVRRADSVIVIAAGAGSGSGSNDDTILVYDSVAAAIVEGAQFYIESSPGDVRETDNLTTDVNGRKLTKLAAGNWTVIVNVPGYFQEGGEQDITNTGDQLDSIFIYTPVFDLPGGDSCLVIIFTDSPGAQAKFTPSSQKFQNVNGVFLNSRVQVSTADGAGIIQRSLPITDSTLQKTTWDIMVWSSDPGRPLLVEVEGYKVPAQTQDTLMTGSR